MSILPLETFQGKAYRGIMIRFTYIGGPTAIIEVDGLRFLTDPTFDHAGTEYPRPAGITLHKTQDPLLEVTAAGAIDAVLLSHDQHADNLDNAGRAMLPSAGRVFTTRSGALRLGAGHTVGLDPWQSATLATPHGNTIRITATPARHGPPGIEKLSGDVIGFVLTLEPAGVDLVYFSGDTVWYAGVAEVAKRFQPAALLLNTGAAQARGPFHLTMNTNDTVEAAAYFPKSVVIPIHCEGWAHFTQTQADLQRTFEALGFADRLATLVGRGRLEVAVPGLAG